MIFDNLGTDKIIIFDNLGKVKITIVNNLGPKREIGLSFNFGQD